MEKENPLENARLPGETFLNLDDPNLDFEQAKQAAMERVKKYDSDPMLVAWYEKMSGKVSPSVSCEDEGGEPGWVTYAKSHGGNLTVNVNHGDYLFIFRSEHRFPA